MEGETPWLIPAPFPPPGRLKPPLHIVPRISEGPHSASRSLLTNKRDYIKVLGYNNLKNEIFYFRKGAKMPNKEEELIERLMRENEEFKKAKQVHAELARQLDELGKRPFLTPQDELDIKVLKKKKLAYKDQMEKILVQYR
jgi:uncharacterized protein